MIYEAGMGADQLTAAVEAVKHDCDKFLHNGHIFQVNIEFKRIGVVSSPVSVSRAETSNDEYDGPPLD